MHFILLCSAKCFSSLVFSEVCCCQKRPCVKEGDGGFPCRGSTPICHRICQSACEHNIAHCHTSLLHCIFALQCNTSACLLQVGQAVGSIDTVWPNHRRPPPVHPLHSTLMHNALVHLLPRIHSAEHTGKRCTFRRLRYLLCGKNALW